MSSSYSQDLHASVLALNNMGVTLLERGCFRQGLEVLQDGISVLKNVFRPAVHDKETAMQSNKDTSIRTTDTNSSPPNSTHSYACSPKDTTTAKLQRAAAKLLQSQTKSCLSSQCVDLVVLSYQSMGLQNVLDQLGPSPCTSRYLCIRMDESTMVGDYTATSPDMESAILLFNFGTAHILLSHWQRRPQPVLENAHYILRLASDIIAHKSQDASCSDNLMDDICLLQLGLIVLHGMIQVMVECGLDDQAARVFGRYTSTRVILQRVQHLPQWLSSCLVSAPAA